MPVEIDGELLETLGDKVLVRRDPGEQCTIGGVWLPTDSHKEPHEQRRPWTGWILGLGPKVAELVPELATGQHVLFNRWTGHRFLDYYNDDEQRLLFVGCEDVHAIIEEE